MALKFQHSYNIVGTPANLATLTSLLTDNTKTVLIKDLPNQMLGFAYIPLTGQSGRYLIVTVEVSNQASGTAVGNALAGGSLPDDVTFKPYSAAIISSSPNEVDLVPVVSAIGPGYGTPLVLPTNSGTPTSTGGLRYEATYNLNLIGVWMRVSVMESGSGNNGTTNVDASINE